MQEKGGRVAWDNKGAKNSEGVRERERERERERGRERERERERARDRVREGQGINVSTKRKCKELFLALSMRGPRATIWACVCVLPMADMAANAGEISDGIHAKVAYTPHRFGKP
jgi:hypothetical protein